MRPGLRGRQFTPWRPCKPGSAWRVTPRGEHAWLARPTFCAARPTKSGRACSGRAGATRKLLRGCDAIPGACPASAHRSASAKPAGQQAERSDARTTLHPLGPGALGARLSGLPLVVQAGDHVAFVAVVAPVAVAGGEVFLVQQVLPIHGHGHPLEAVVQTAQVVVHGGVVYDL